MAETLTDPDTALRIILEACTRLPAETVSVAEIAASAKPRILHADVSSPARLPPFDNSAMDGFALTAAGEQLGAGTELQIRGEQAAGDEAVRARDAEDGAWAIMTGARLPEGLDRVIPVERVEKLDNPVRIRLLAEVARHQNIRPAGSDVQQGTTILRAGSVLEPQQLMLLAALGVAQVQVRTRPRVSVICTGKELVDDPTQSLASGQIYNSNRPFFCMRIPLAGAELASATTVGDEDAAFIAALEQARGAGTQMIISSGAVSMGTHDFVPRILKQQGAEILFHKLSIRPGKPLLFARLAEGTLYFGLPGNPCSTAVGLRFFAERALRAMLGLDPEKPWRVPLDNDYPKKPGFRHHLKSRLTLDAGGQLRAHVLEGQASYRIGPLANANAWVVAPVQVNQLEAGQRVDVYGLGHLQRPQAGLPTS